MSAPSPTPAWGANKYPPHGQVTPTDHGAYVVITTWITMCLMSLAVLTRMLTRLASFRAPTSGDWTIAVAWFLAITQSVAVHLAVNHGLGRHRASLTTAEFQAYSKANYTSQVLYQAVICLAKISLLLFISRLTASKSTRQVCRLVMILVGAWSIAAAFALVFQCQAPHTWDFTPGRCVDQGALYYANGVINIVTDLMIIALPAAIIWSVLITRKQRMTVIFVFGIRITLCALTIAQLMSLGPLLSSADQTWENVNPSLWNQGVMNWSIITACIPCLRPFLASLQSGLLDTAMHDRKTSPAESYALHSIKTSYHSRGFGTTFPVRGRTNVKISTHVSHNLPGSDSRDMLNEEAIHQRTELQVDYGDRRSA
ncbi:MAG: hypothetical protein M1838_002393 [Thelocarpon superellum]|nr:MAG: hypothetical protein M1838_002393 [Thelocarpon superellum]